MRRSIAIALMFACVWCAPRSSSGDRGAAFAAMPSPVRLSARVVSPQGRADGSVFIEAVADIDSGWHINANKPTFDYLIPTALTVSMPAGFSAGELRYPAAVSKTLPFAEAPLDLYEGRAVFVAELWPEGAAAGLHRIDLTLNFQPCDDLKCLPPSSATAFVEVDIGETFAAAPREAGSTSVAGAAAPAFGSMSLAAIIETRGWPVALALIFLAGLALNLTPCVYPMIPVTVAYFGGRAATGAKNPWRGAIAYFLGIVVTYSALGTAAGLTGGLFGAALQHPAVSVGLSLLMLVMAAAMFGWIPFAVPQALMPAPGAGRSVPFGPFGMGVTMGVVAAPCIGPFIVALLAYVGSNRSAMLGFSLFAVLSAGLGLPYLILGVFSGRIRQLPKSGEWMEVVKWIFGFVLAGMSVYFIGPLISARTQAILYGGTIAAAGVTAVILASGYGSGRRLTAAWRAGLGVGAVLCFVSAYHAGMPRADSDDGFWLAYDEVSHESALASGRFVFLDFTAEWCLPCKVMDRTTYADPRVRAALDRAVRMKVDLTNYESAESMRARRVFGITGVPTAVYIDPSGAERFRWLGEFSADDLLRELEAVR